jgi:hypothetical protein
MKTYDYMHEGLTDGLTATPGRIYTVLRTLVKLKDEAVDGWRATKQVVNVNDDKFRVFTNENGSVAYFGNNDVLR